MKKAYRKPLVESEEVLEQTSLACNATEDYDIGVTFSRICDQDVSKGGNWGTNGCTGGTVVSDLGRLCVPTLLS